jgi:hypothetical protein
MAESTTPKRLARRTAHGSGPATPALALTGVGIVVGCAVALLVGIAFALYYLI